MRRTLSIRWIIAFTSFSLPGFTQVIPAQILKVHIPQSSPTILSNSITDFGFGLNSVWVGTGRGLNRTTNNGLNWTNFVYPTHLGKGGVSAMWVSGDTIWVATGYDETVQSDVFPVGSGISRSTDGGSSWIRFPQPVDSENVVGYTPIRTGVGNVTYDMARIGNTLWIGSFYGGLRRSTDLGQTWYLPNGNRGPDTLSFDSFDRLNHRIFSVISDSTRLWVGTAEGVNLSTDNGTTWQNFQYNGSPDQLNGNFVVALGRQKFSSGQAVIWASCLETSPGQKRGLAFTFNDGQTWTQTLSGKTVHNLAFLDSMVYAAADDGLYSWKLNSSSGWVRMGEIIDSMTGDRIRSREFFSVGVPDVLNRWVGTADGLAHSVSAGTDWTIVKSYQSVPAEKKETSYARPNPFSPTRGDPPGTYLVFSLDPSATFSIRIFNVAMEPVRNLVSEKWLVNPYEYWDGRDDQGKRVANGVYFYRIKKNGKLIWGKVAVIN